jgi:hypothetical protein
MADLQILRYFDDFRLFYKMHRANYPIRPVQIAI